MQLARSINKYNMCFLCRQGMRKLMKMKICTACFREVTLTKAFQGWMEYSVYQQGIRWFVENATHRWSTRIKTCVLTSWRISNSKRLISKQLNKMRLKDFATKTKARVFESWTKWAQCSMFFHVQYQRVITSAQHQSLASYFKQWICAAGLQQTSRQKATKATQFWSIRMTRISILFWRNLSGEKTRLRLSCIFFQNKICNGLVSFSLSSWRRFSIDKRCTRDLTIASVDYMSTKKIRGSIVQWRKISEQLANQAYLLAKADQKRKGFRKRKCFQIWRNWVHSAFETKKKILMVQESMKENLTQLMIVWWFQQSRWSQTAGGSVNPPIGMIDCEVKQNWVLDELLALINRVWSFH